MDFPPVGFIRRRPAIFDLDTVSRLFLAHWLTPEPLHHPTGSPPFLARRHICLAIGDAGIYMLALLRLYSVRRTRPARRNDIAFEPFATQNERWRALVLFDGGQSLG